MEGVIVLVVLATVFGGAAAVAFAGREQCPEREPDLSDEDRAYLRGWTQSDSWEVRP